MLVERLDREISTRLSAEAEAAKLRVELAAQVAAARESKAYADRTDAERLQALEAAALSKERLAHELQSMERRKMQLEEIAREKAATTVEQQGRSAEQLFPQEHSNGHHLPVRMLSRQRLADMSIRVEAVQDGIDNLDRVVNQWVAVFPSMKNTHHGSSYQPGGPMLT